MKVPGNRVLWMCVVAVATVLAWNAFVMTAQDDARALDDGYAVLSGYDIRFRVEGKKGDAVVGRFVVRLDGKWREVDVPAVSRTWSAR